MRAEVRLRIPNLKDRPKNEAGYPIDFTDLRFRKIMEIPSIPHAGEPVELTTRGGLSVVATIGGVELDEERELFVLSCQYPRRRITPDEYQAFANDPDWELKHLLDR